MPAGPRKSDYLNTNFLLNFPPISVPFMKEKHPIWPNWVLFYNNLPQIHPNLCNLGSFVSDENPRIAIPNFAKKRPKRQAHICIPCQCVNLPGLKHQLKSIRNACLRSNLPVKQGGSQTTSLAWKGHWPLNYLWPQGCWSHMCDSTQGSLCPSPIKIHQSMWIQWPFLQKLETKVIDP